MSRKRRSRSNKSRQRPATVSAAGNIEAVQTRAEAALVSGRFKEAIGNYKALLKEENRDSWINGLARAYASRAVELADKGMLAEALSIWEQRAATCNTPLASPGYLIWQLQAGRIKPALEHYQQLTRQSSTINSGASGDMALLRENLAALALSGDTRIVDALAGDDPIVRDFAVADNLLTAFCAGDNGQIEAALKGISHRSPYRDFRQIIKAWHQCERSPADVPDVVGRIARCSPFHPLAVILQERYSGTLSTASMLQADNDTQVLLVALHGWTGKQAELLKAAAALGPEPNARALFNLLVSHAELFDAQDARTAALKLLPHYPPGRRGFAKTFGQLSALEASLLEAHICELEDDPHNIEAYWHEVLEVLENPSLPDCSDTSLCMALVLRRLADWMLEVGDDNYTRSVAIDYLSKSLVHDPEDVGAYVSLIALNRRSNRLKEARYFVTRALERFPHDVGVLLEAVRTALANNAFKKAAGIARELLKIDPINVKVQSILIDAHLAHARKQIRSRKLDLARNEIESATVWVRNRDTEGQILLLRGLLECVAGNEALGRDLLRQGVEVSGGALVGQYRLMIESEQLDSFSGHDYLEKADLPDPSTFASREHVLALMAAVTNTRDITVDSLGEALQPLLPALDSLDTDLFTQAQMLQVCEALLRTESFDELSTFALLAQLRWPNSAIFHFHTLYASSEGEFYELDEEELELFDQAFDMARDEGDDRTLHRLVEFMNQPAPLGLPRGFPFGPPSGAPAGLPTGFPAGLGSGFPAELAQLMDELGPDGMEALLESFESGSMNPFSGTPLELGNAGGKRSPKPKPNKKKKPKATPEKSDAKDPAVDPDQGELF